MRYQKTRLVLTLVIALGGCTAKSSYVQPPAVRSRYLITMDDTDRTYQSLGYIQLTRKGADMLGFVPVVDADLERLFGQDLIRELRKRGADGIINVRFHERQWTTAERIIFLIPPLILFPLPTKVTLRGELIRFT